MQSYFYDPATAASGSRPYTYDRCEKWHIPGDLILPKAAVEAIYGDLRRLHDDVLRREKILIASKIQDTRSTWLTCCNKGCTSTHSPRKSSSFDSITYLTCFVRTPIPCHIDLAGNTSYHFAASRTVFPRLSPYLCPGPFAPFGTCI